MDEISAVAPWPVVALTLLWLARRRPSVYARAAIALLLSSAAGLVYAGSSAMQDLPAREGRLLHEYVALPGVYTGWYLLMALAAVACVSAIRLRIAVVVGALTGVASSVLILPHHELAAVWGAVVPLCSWFVAGCLQRRSLWSLPAPGPWDPPEQAIPSRPLPQAAGERSARTFVPLRQAG
ncbi:hypothetical protein OG206_01840 [Streptomyces sp. NBC_01341]|uniref:hypothetical protein n=1 Tax=Streptomyces sp. NBC_01341 TaxID=2903831 RepID=UPI002E0F82B7|nr:hypothetical protein OG206_01840 [Streptomyces sp. NBC_01341]